MASCKFCSARGVLGVTNYRELLLCFLLKKL